MMHLLSIIVVPYVAHRVNKKEGMSRCAQPGLSTRADDKGRQKKCRPAKVAECGTSSGRLVLLGFEVLENDPFNIEAFPFEDADDYLLDQLRVGARDMS